MSLIGDAKRAVNAYIERRLAPTTEMLGLLRGELEGSRELTRGTAADAAALRADVLRLHQEVGGLQQAVHMIARRPRQRRVLRCLFLVHYMEAWASIANVVSEMEAAGDFEPIVASIPRRLPGSPTFKDEPLTHERLTRLGVRHIRLVDTETTSLRTLLMALDPDVVFRQSQWDADVPTAFSADNLNFARLCLIPYEAMNLVENVAVGGDIGDSATDSPLHRACWMVFCANERVKARATEKSWSTVGRNFVVTGHPKADRVRSAVPPGPRARGGPFTILWSAHHSIDEHWTRFGTFPSVAEDMASWAHDRPDFTFVFSPHPSLVTMMEASTHPLTGELVENFVRQWRQLPNTEFFVGGPDGGYVEAFARSDVLVTDGLSFLLEYQLANRPVIFLERDGHRPFNDLGETVLQGVHAVSDIASAKRLVDAFAVGQSDPLAAAQRDVVAELLGLADSATRIVEAIRSGFAVEDGRGDVALLRGPATSG